MPFVKLENGLKINYQLEGKKDGELLLLIHGYGSWLQSYDEIFPALTKKFLVLRSDLRGHGDSDKPAGKNYEETKALYTLDHFAEDNYLLLKALKLLDKHKKIYVYGHSMGGMITQVFTLKYPNIIKKLILGSTSSYMRSEGTEQLIKDIKSGKMPINRANFEFMSLLGYTVRFKKSHKEVLEKEVQGKLKCSPDALLAAMENFVYNFDVRDQVKNIKVPTLILTGDKDSLIAYKRSLELKESIPNSKLVIFEKQNHGINVEVPERVIDEIIKFID